MLWLIVVVLGAWGMVEWLRHDIRVIDLIERLATHQNRISQFVVRVYRCGFCLSHWVAGLCLVCMFIPLGWILPSFFAVVRVANLLNDLTYAFNRSPHKRNK